MEDRYNVTPEQYEEAVTRVSKVHKINIIDLNPEEQTLRVEGEVQNLNTFWDDLENELVYLENGEDQEGVATEGSSKSEIGTFYTQRRGLIYVYIDYKFVGKFPSKQVAKDQGYDLDGAIRFNADYEVEDSAEEAFEQEEEMYGFEATSSSGMESLTSAVAKAIELFGSVETIRFIQDSDNFSDDYKDQLTFIKNTVDLSDSTAVLNEIISTSETMLDNFEVDDLAERIEQYVEVSDNGEEELGEYQEPDDWSSVDEPISEGEPSPESKTLPEEPVEDTLEDSDLEDGLNSPEDDDNI